MSAVEYPITVNKIDIESLEALRPKLLFGGKCGDFVAVRPCDDKFQNKTYLGVLIGEVAMTVSARYSRETGVLLIGMGLHNPAILIPEFGEVVYGCGSWWGRIKDPAHLRQITNDDISNVWYVQALKQLQEKAGGDS